MGQRFEQVRMLRARLVGDVNREVGDVVELEEQAAEHFVHYKDAEYLREVPEVVGGDDEANDEAVRSILSAVADGSQDRPVGDPGPEGEPGPADAPAAAEAAPAATEAAGRRGQRLPAR
ncbi:hypothetical protein [Paludisphaera soli]|uniref:hypothetical protein n=1 Tax=Paludisphaera soli TaxID=2712865 RepID=UPI0013E9A5AB|nr:hypothetical protein [Paludisphaera soli]